MKTKIQKQNEKKSRFSCIVLNGEPITIQCPDSQKLNSILLEITIALAEAAEFNNNDGYLSIANSNNDLRNLIRVARMNMALL